MYFKSLIITFAFISLFAFVVQGKNSCTSSSVLQCNNDNQRCLSEVLNDDAKSCECIFKYNECLNSLGCDPNDPDFGGTSKADPGNANGQYDMIRQSCVSFNCNPTGICDLAGSEKLYASFSLMIVLTVISLILI